MNRVAVKIKEARLKAKLTEKQLAKKCGLSEGYILQIESGKKVINEKAAESILNALGAKLDFIDRQEEEREEKPKAEKIAPPKVEFYNIQPTEQWTDALANIIKKYPIYEAGSNKVVGQKELPIIGKRVEGYHWDKLLFIQAADDSLETLRVKKGDVVMVCMTNEIQNNSVYYFEMDQKKYIRQLRKEANNRVILSTGKKDSTEEVDLKKIKLIGKCVRVEHLL